MNTTLAPVLRRGALPALAAGALALGLALGPLGAVAAPSDEPDDALVATPVDLELDGYQLPTLADDPAVVPAPEAAPVTPPPPAEFTATTGQIRGVVTDYVGNPLPNTAVAVRTIGGQFLFNRITDAAGAYATGELAPGEYRLSFSKAGYLFE